MFNPLTESPFQLTDPLTVPQVQLGPAHPTSDPKLMLDRAMLFSQTLLGLLDPEAIAQAEEEMEDAELQVFQ